MGIRIHHLSGAMREQTCFFNAHRITIGRRADRDVRFDPQADTMVSADHAEIVYAGDAWHLRDKESANGVWVGGRRVAEMVLRGGEEVEFGEGGPKVRIDMCVTEPPRPSFVRNLVQDAVRRGYSRIIITLAVLIALLVGAMIYLALELYSTRDDLRRIEMATKSPSEIGEAIARANSNAVFLLISRKPTGEEEGFCTGFAVSKTTLMTNAHCVLQIEKLVDEAEGGAFFAAPNEGMGARFRLLSWRAHVSYDENSRVPTPDLGMITVEGRLPNVVSIAAAEQLRQLSPGSQIFVFGFPGDLSSVRSPVATLTEGVVGRMTALDGTAATPDGRYLLQHSAFTSKGTSGSPVFDKFGRVVAVNSGYYQGRSLVTIENPVTGKREEAKVSRDLAGYSFGIRVDLSKGLH